MIAPESETAVGFVFFAPLDSARMGFVARSTPFRHPIHQVSGWGGVEKRNLVPFLFAEIILVTTTNSIISSLELGAGAC